MSRAILPATASAFSVLAVVILIATTHQFGSLSSHMALHIALMNVAAPLIAGMLVRRSESSRPTNLWAIAAFQIMLLWIAHAPSVHRLMAGSQLLQASMHMFLFVTALFFWRALLGLSPNCRWQVIPVLLLTGKLFCLLAVLLIFAPRLLYEMPASEHVAHVHGTSVGLADQQLAGLLMVAACPLSYLVAGVIFAAQIIRPGLSAASQTRPSAATGP